ncbi:MAG: hypothetical protein AB1725_09860 [Armatimonadota bacterium]
MKAILWVLRALFALALSAALFGNLFGPGWGRIGIIGALVLLVALLVLRWVDLARRKQSPAYL